MDNAIDTTKHVVGTAGGGGIIAALLAFFQGRERAVLRDRIAHLEGRVDVLERLLQPTKPVKPRRKK